MDVLEAIKKEEAFVYLNLHPWIRTLSILFRGRSSRSFMG